MADEDVILEENEDTTGTTYTVDDAVDRAGYGKFQAILTCISGLGWTADACEIIILSIIGDMLACTWKITKFENSVMSSCVFFGMMIGSPVFGILADKYGRKSALLGSMWMLFAFGCLSAAAWNYLFVVIFRALMGFALGGIPQALTLCCEYYPIRIRAKAGFFLCYYWAAGTITIILVSWGVMSAFDSWRVLLVIAALPALTVALSFKWYPESARYYLVSDQYEEAKDILEKMVRMNKKEMPEGRLIHEKQIGTRGSFKDLFNKENRVSIVIFWYIWFAIAFTYYGICFMSPHIITEGELKPSVTNKTFWEDMSTNMECKKLTTGNFLNLLWTSSAELPGLVVFTFLVEVVDRKTLLGVSSILTAVLIGLLLIRNVKVLTLFFLFGARALSLAIFQHTFIMTSETFPTSIRALAMGTSSSWCRLGGLLTPYVSQILVAKSPVAAISVFSIICALAGGLAFLLPHETRGASMN